MSYFLVLEEKYSRPNFAKLYDFGITCFVL